MQDSNQSDQPFHYYGHSNPEFPDFKDASKHWEPLFTKCEGYPKCTDCQNLSAKHGHSNKVAWWTARFMEKGGFAEKSKKSQVAAQWGCLIGQWHDLGKFAPEWQEYLKRKVDPHIDDCTEKVDHSTAGAQHAVRKHPLGHLLAYGIMGHHSGLPDTKSNQSCLASRLKKQKIYSPSGAPAEVIEKQYPPLPEFLKAAQDPFSCSFFVRMLFSCLVDADFLCTEAFMNKERHEERNTRPPNILQLIENLVVQRIEKFGHPSPEDIVNYQRSKVVKDCSGAAERKTGLFSLTVPTGGGKTLSSLLFALRHAIRHKQSRIIYVIPFTSIIEQNADVIREIIEPLQSDSFTPLIEHHSSLDSKKETNQSRLASENWDAPIIITTAVQFYESLYASKTSKSRKLHNIANSVVILDEAQTLPVNYLAPCLRVLEELTNHYNTTAVLCTATQPEINFSEEFPIGLKNCTEIIQDTKSLFDALKRVTIEKSGQLSDAELVDKLKETPQSLCIVNRRKHAQKLFKELPKNKTENFHLSALMCPAHRREILSTIRYRLDKKQPVRLVSTQLIEAGVDVDFPIVYRSLAGIDSIAQAAGRCNRNGKLHEFGEVYIFVPEDQKAEVYFKETAQKAAQVLELHEDILSTNAIKQYFDLYYYEQKNRWDEKQILLDFKIQTSKTLPFQFQFKEAAQKFKLIENDQETVLIPYNEEAESLINELKNPFTPIKRSLIRKLQPYTVQIRAKEKQENSEAFEEIRDGQFTALISKENNYSDQFGLNFDNEQILFL